MGWGGFARAIFDPANLSGRFDPESSSSGPDVPTTWNTQTGITSMPGRAAAIAQGVNNDKRAEGYFSSMAPPGIAKAFNPNLHIAPPEFNSQWQYSAGKGPQWVEPQRISAKDDYAAVVNNGPAKGNRF
jgi:hypothetical protein